MDLFSAKGLIIIFPVAVAILFLLYKLLIKKVKTMSKGITQSTADFITKEEGKRNTVYKDSIGIDTVGIGHKVLPKDNLKTGDVITDERVNTLFKEDGKRFEKDILTHIKKPLTQNQFDALFSLVYNIGQGAFDYSTILKEVNTYNLANLSDEEKEDLSNAWLAFSFAGGKFNEQLHARRQRELDLFLS